MANAHGSTTRGVPVLLTSHEIGIQERRNRRQAERERDMQRKTARLQKHFDRRAGR